MVRINNFGPIARPNPHLQSPQTACGVQKRIHVRSPITHRLTTSIKAVKYTVPLAVRMYVMSTHHTSWGEAPLGRKLFQQIRMNLVLLTPFAQVEIQINRLQAHHWHQPVYNTRLRPTLKPVPTRCLSNPPISLKRTLRIDIPNRLHHIHPIRQKPALASRNSSINSPSATVLCTVCSTPDAAPSNARGAPSSPSHGQISLKNLFQP